MSDTHPNPKDPQAELREALLALHREYKYSPQYLYLDKLEALFQAREQQMIDEVLALIDKNKLLAGQDGNALHIIGAELLTHEIKQLQNKTNDGGRNGGL